VVDAASVVARAFGAARTPEVFPFDGNRMLVFHGVWMTISHGQISAQLMYSYLF
jgi:hypothetical protein